MSFWKNPIIKFGLIAAAGVLIGIFAISYPLAGENMENSKVSEIVGYLTMILSLTAVYIGMRRVRDQEGALTLGRGFWVGLQISLIAAFIFGAFTYGFYKWKGPEFVDKMNQHYVEQVKNSGQSESEIERQLAEMERWRELTKNNFFQGFLMFSTVALLGMVISICSAFILRSRPEQKPA